jgi:RNA recognition motif-containing protein
MAVVDKRIFVNGVPPHLTKEDLTAHFDQYGQTVDVYLPLFYGTSQHKGICYVTFATGEAASLALSQGHFIRGSSVTVETCYSKDKGGAKGKGSSSAKDRLFITKVPPEATREEVEELFSRFGAWTDVYLPAGSFPAGHKGICFIQYIDPQSAQLAMQCGPHVLHDQELVVDLATPRDSSKGGKGGKGEIYPRFPMQPMVSTWGAYPAAPLHPGMFQQAPSPALGTPVGLKPGRLFLTKVADDVTKEDLIAYFQSFGELADVFVPTGKSIAFVSFVHSEMVQSVMTTTEHEVKPGRVVTVDLAFDRPPLEAKGKGKFRFQPYS